MKQVSEASGIMLMLRSIHEIHVLCFLFYSIFNYNVQSSTN